MGHPAAWFAPGPTTKAQAWVKQERVRKALGTTLCCYISMPGWKASRTSCAPPGRPFLPAPHPQVLGHMLPLPPGEVIYQKGLFLPAAETSGGCCTLMGFCQHPDTSLSAFNPGSFIKAEHLSTPNHTPPPKLQQPYSSHTRSLSPTPSLTPGSEQGLETGSAARCHQHFNWRSHHALPLSQHAEMCEEQDFPAPRALCEDDGVSSPKAAAPWAEGTRQHCPPTLVLLTAG